MEAQQMHGRKKYWAQNIVDKKSSFKLAVRLGKKLRAPARLSNQLRSRLISALLGIGTRLGLARGLAQLIWFGSEFGFGAQLGLWLETRFNSLGARCD